jgi:hypothetical protein
MSEQKWFAVRQVFHHTARGLYEERITLWIASTFEDAIAQANREGDAYAAGGDEGVVRLSFSGAFQLFDPPASGREVYSDMRESELDPKDYVKAFFDTGRERTQRIPADE